MSIFTPRVGPERVVVENTEKYLVTLEWNEMMPFIHCSVYEWSKKIYKELLEVFVDIIDGIAEHGYNNVYCWMPPEKNSIKRFAEMFGFVDCGVTEYTNISYRLMRYKI